MNKSNNIWNRFAEKHPSASKWIREGGLFVIVSNLITVLKYFMYHYHHPMISHTILFRMLISVSRESTLHYSVRHLNGISSDMMRRMADCRTSVHT